MKGVRQTVKPTTPEEAVGCFLSLQKRRGRTNSTLIRYEPCLASFVEWAGSRRLSEIGAADIDLGFFTWWCEKFEKRYDRAPTASSIRAVYTPLSSLYRFLTNYGFLVDDDGRPLPNPMLAIEPPKTARRRNDWLRPTEDDVLLDIPMSEIEEILIWFLRWSGLRLGEALQLRIRDVDLDTRTLIVSDSKTENGIREVPIVPELIPRIRRWLAHLEKKGLNRPQGFFLCTTRSGTWKDPTTNRIARSEAGRPMKPQQVERIVRRVGERAGIERLTPHRLRRTFGSFFLNGGVRLEIVSNLLGHGDTRVTQQAYAQLTNGTVRREMLMAVGAG